MCGIAGIVGRERERIGALVAALAHRGPDARGAQRFDELGVALGHARLSILDLDPRSNQPFASESGRFVLVFNGEIYNYRELGARLEADGVALRTRSDTEVLLHWIARRGVAGLRDLDGMFAFALLDRVARTLTLARDPIGEKPLYYAEGERDGERWLAFASEIPPLLELDAVDRSLDPEGLADYLRFLYTAAPHTLYRGVRELEPGHAIEIALDAPRAQARRYFDLEATLAPSDDTPREQTLERIRDAFAQTLAPRLRADVPLGMYLSGGLDSNAIVGLARKVEPRARFETFTMRYDGSRLAQASDESELAARAARWHRVDNVQERFADDDAFTETLDAMLAVFGQPFGNATAIVAERLAARASRRTRVCLVGDGGDELFAGYPRHRALALHAALSVVPGAVRRSLALPASLLPESGSLAPVTRRAKRFAAKLASPAAEAFVDWSSYLGRADLELALGRSRPTQLEARLLTIFERHAASPLRAAALVDLASFVPYNLMQAADRTSMAHGLELRCPFLAPKLIAAALSAPDRHKLERGRSKPLLVDACRDVLPPFVTERKKRAFNPPMQAFVRRHLPELRRLLLAPGARARELFSPRFLEQQIEAFDRRRCDNSTLLWGLASLERWLARPARGRHASEALVARSSPAGVLAASA